IDDSQLLEAARDADVTVELKYRPGHFVVKGCVIAYVWPSTRVDQALTDSVIDTLTVGDQRTQTQDIEYLIDQLVTVAVRALSPAINDPFTAMMVIDRLGETLCGVAQHVMPSRYRYDHEHNLRVVANPVTFEEMLRSSFDQIRYYGKNDKRVIAHVFKTILLIRDCATQDPDEVVLRSYLDQFWKDHHGTPNHTQVYESYSSSTTL
ncbi:MAG: DUF2254 domain-containing protein, partial [Anaerolineae bacterium]|nr:DUF2254 domain-containing protein [Anaerolineae bacterium]